MNNSKLMDELYQDNVDYRRSRDRHQECERALEELQSRKYLTPEEEVKAKSLKKEKLVLKDKMEQILQDSRKN